ncbi:hypothetical protein OIU76_000487 [Salix suchowensis]|nr:hypothetical protein OIU76_000487 [Salix suchowensis]
MDGQTICSGHVDGNLRLWAIQTGKLSSEAAATSIYISQNGSVVLTSGRDARSLEVCGKSRATGNRSVASNWNRSCSRPDDNYVAACSADGSLHIWSISKDDIEWNHL